jgi:hypothetical protein
MKIAISNQEINREFVREPEKLIFSLDSNVEVKDEKSLINEDALIITLSFEFFVQENKTLIGSIHYKTWLQIIDVSNIDADIIFIDDLIKLEYNKAIANLETEFGNIPELFTSDQCHQLALKTIQLLVQHDLY